MKRFIGTKMILGKPMTLGDYNLYRGWDIPADEDPNKPGYLVEYPDKDNTNHPHHDGYISWSPAEAFKAYRPTDGMTFGLAIEAMKKGYMVARVGWNGKNMFVYFVQGTHPFVYEMRGNAAKAVELRKKLTNGASSHQNICGHIDMMAADGSIVVGWLASQTDINAEDWMIVE